MDCHLADPSLPSYDHVLDWQASPHGEAKIGCERCHGGDVTTFRKFLAHRGMARASDTASPLHPDNLPRFCGSCHAAAWAAWRGTAHARNEPDGMPTCRSCHGVLARESLGASGLRVSCSRCHDAASDWPDPSNLALGPIALREYRDVVRALRAACSKAAKVTDGSERHELEATCLSTEEVLEEAIERGHAMDLQEMLDAVNRAKSSLESLLGAAPAN